MDRDSALSERPSGIDITPLLYQVLHNARQLPKRRRPSQDAALRDAHLAALAIEHGAAIYSTDHDFRRFPGIEHVNPLA